MSNATQDNDTLTKAPDNATETDDYFRIQGSLRWNDGLASYIYQRELLNKNFITKPYKNSSVVLEGDMC